MQLFTDSAGGKSLCCAAYLDGQWAVLRWPTSWHNETLADITYLEIIQITMAIHLWKEIFSNKKNLFHLII